jgi:hypothetical protein
VYFGKSAPIRQKKPDCVRVYIGNLRDVKEMISTVGSREILKGVRSLLSSYLTFIRS